MDSSALIETFNLREVVFSDDTAPLETILRRVANYLKENKQIICPKLSVSYSEFGTHVSLRWVVNSHD
jgi:hypothetical protein